MRKPTMPLMRKIHPSLLLSMFCSTSWLLAAGATWMYRFTDDNLRLTADHNCRIALKKEYDDTQQSQVLGVYYAIAQGTGDKKSCVSINFPDQKAFVFESAGSFSINYKGNGSDSRIQLVLQDSSGEIFIHKNNLSTDNQSWRQAEGVFSSGGSNTHHWGGNRDGIMDAPLRLVALRIIASDYQGNQPVYLHSLTATRLPDNNLHPGQTRMLAHSTAPGAAKTADGLHIKWPETGQQTPVRPEDNAVVTLTLTNNSPADKEILIRASRQLLLEDSSELAKQKLILPPGKQADYQLPWKFTAPGVHCLQFEIIDGQQRIHQTSAVNVWEPVGNHCDDNPECYFGCMQPLDNFMQYLDQDLANMQSAGVKILRFLLRWRTVEAEPGIFNWTVYDRIFTKLKEYNIIPYPILAQTPSWAADPQTAAQAPGFVMSFAPGNISDYTNFVSRVIERYRSYTRYFQIWNEPYASHYFWGGTPEYYLQMLRAAYGAAHQLHPEVKINAGAALLNNSDSWNAQIFKQAKGSYDYWPFHCHGDSEALHQTLAFFRKIMRDDYQPALLWNDESGFNVNPDVEYSEVQRAAVIIKKLIIGRAEGLSNHTWFLFRNFPATATNPRDNFPALDANGHIRPVVLAHNTAAGLLQNSRCMAKYHFPNLGEAYLFDRESDRILVLWRGALQQGQLGRLLFNRPFDGRKIKLFGQNEDIRGAREHMIFLTEAPIFYQLPRDLELLNFTIESLFDFPKQITRKHSDTEINTSFTINNILPKTITGKISIGENSSWTGNPGNLNFTVSPQSRQEFPLHFIASQNNADSRQIIPVRITLHNNTPENFAAELQLVTCNSIHRVLSPADRYPDWVDKYLVCSLEMPEFFHNLRLGDVDPDLSWQGKEDLSGRFYAAYDQKNLYLGFIAVDDIHYQKTPGEGIWEQDSLQIALYNMKDTYLQFGIALRNDKTLTAEYYQPQGREIDFPFSVQRQGIITTYNLALPWDKIQVTPSPGAIFSLSLLLNDNDGRTRKVILEWGGGIHGLGGTGLMRPMLLE